MVYIVIPHYIINKELEELAKNTIRSMRNTSDVFIVSVDDGSTLDTAFLKEMSDHYIKLEKNSGFGKACNAGFKWCLKQKDATYIGCANNDIEVFDGWIEALIEPFTKWDNVGITGLVSSKDRELASTSKGRKITEGGLLDEKMQSGGLWLSKPAVLRVTGLFDEQFELGGEEDVDLFLRVRDKFNYHIVMSDKSMFWHKEGATRWDESHKDRYKATEQKNYDKFAKKWGFDIRNEGLNFYEYILEK